MPNSDDDFRKLSIDSFFNFEADGIDIAKSQVKLIHNTGDIPASGDQFEISIRDFFRSKLPIKYYISNGHLIDHSLSCTPQMDMIIADNFRSPILYKTYNGTEYLTYESVYAYSEIKSSWQKKYIEEFIITRERISKFLKRNDVSPCFIDAGGKGILLDTPTTANSFKNPLFSFMFFGDSEKFNFSHIKDLYNETDWKFLPNVLCLYDKGLVVNIDKTELEQGRFKINLYPEFVENDEQNKWVLVSYDQKRSVLGTLYYIILEHLNTCVLEQPNMLHYMQNIFTINKDNIDFINEF